MKIAPLHSIVQDYIEWWIFILPNKASKFPLWNILQRRSKLNIISLKIVVEIKNIS